MEKLEKLEAQLKEWGVDLEKFKAKADTTKEERKAEHEKEVAALQAKLNEAQKRLAEFKQKGSAASGELKKRVEDAWAGFKKAYESATRKFK